MATPEACNQIVDNLFKVLVDGYKHDYIGEKISQLDHCLQAAAQAVDAGTIIAFILTRKEGCC